MNMGKLHYIDGIKGVAIISVILLHAFPKTFLHQSFAYIHIWQAVPLFVFVSFFLLFRKMETSSLADYFSGKRWEVLFRRVIKPFLIVQLIFIILLGCTRNRDALLRLLQLGGTGKGSYYPYIYLQIWLIAPFIYKMLKSSPHMGGVVLIFTTFLFNYILVGTPEKFYSCFIVRYLFMAYLAYIWLKKKYNVVLLFFLPLVSIAYWIIYELGEMPKGLYPGWGSQQFPTFFYTLLVVFLIQSIYHRIGSSNIEGSSQECRYHTIPVKNHIKLILEWLGRNSYEIFLMQMLFFMVVTCNLLGLVNSDLGQFFIYPVLALIGSILPICVLKRALSNSTC